MRLFVVISVLLLRCQPDELGQLGGPPHNQRGARFHRTSRGSARVATVDIVSLRIS